jgi:integrase
MTSPHSKKGTWRKTRIQNLVRHQNGGYYVRVTVQGKQVWRSLGTKLVEVAKRRMAPVLEEVRNRPSGLRADCDRLTFAQAIRIRESQLEHDPALKPATRHYWRQCHDSLLRTWTDLADRELSTIRREECEEWAGRKFKTGSPTRFNNTVAALRKIFEIGIEQGLCSTNPADRIKRRKPRPRTLELPTLDQFHDWVGAIRGANGRFSRACGDFVELLAYSGMRKGEAKELRWKDVDFERREILIRGHEETGTKNWETRRVPMIAALESLLLRMRDKRGQVGGDECVPEVFEAQKAMTHAAAKLNIGRLTHHDLRHFFATRCIESGVDIPTVARWLGHRDGGVLAMRIYGHLRDEHSQASAGRVAF